MTLHRLLVVAGVTASAIAGCREHAATPPDPAATTPIIAAPESPSNDVLDLVRVFKLGGAGGKQVLSRLIVRTPVGDDFTLTEQVGATQLELRGRVIALGGEKFRVQYDYAETSASGQKRLQSTVEMQANTEQQIGHVRGGGDDEATESIVLGVSRP